LSHFSRLKVQVKDLNAFHKVLFLRGLTSEKLSEYRNSYSGEAVKDATVVKNQSGKILMAVDAEGNVTVDSWSMGHEYQNIMQDYARETIFSSASAAGGWVGQETVDKNGDVVLEICFA
jgi:hypothetical protein